MVPYEFLDCFFYFCIEHHWDFNRDFIESVDHYGSMYILKIVTMNMGCLSILSVSSLIFLIIVYTFQCTGLSPLVKFTSKYCILCTEVDNGFVFLIYFSDFQ